MEESKNLHQTQRLEHYLEENERPYSNATTETATATTTITGPRQQQQGTLDNLLPQHAARARRLEKAARRHAGSSPSRQGPQNIVGSDAVRFRRGGDQRGAGSGRRPLKLMRSSSGA